MTFSTAPHSQYLNSSVRSPLEKNVANIFFIVLSPIKYRKTKMKNKKAIKITKAKQSQSF